MIVAATETSVALLAGWMIFPFLFSHGLAPDEGSQLAFVTLPRVFEDMAGGAWIAILFFGLFFVAAFSSSVAGGNLVHFSGVLGGALLCWFVSPRKIVSVLGASGGNGGFT